MACMLVRGGRRMPTCCPSVGAPTTWGPRPAAYAAARQPVHLPLCSCAARDAAAVRDVERRPTRCVRPPQAALNAARGTGGPAADAAAAPAPAEGGAAAAAFEGGAQLQQQQEGEVGEGPSCGSTDSGAEHLAMQAMQWARNPQVGGGRGEVMQGGQPELVLCSDVAYGLPCVCVCACMCVCVCW